jgi:hypothetical protein
MPASRIHAEPSSNESKKIPAYAVKRREKAPPVGGVRGLVGMWWRASEERAADVGKTFCAWKKIRHLTDLSARAA